jgi:hypothetical protein
VRWNVLKALHDFMLERQRILVRKDCGQPRPWTDDPILQKYFISNLRCEDDKTTRWLKAYWRDPHEDDPDLWFAIAVFRRGLNLPATGEKLGYPVPWDEQKFRQACSVSPYCNPHAYKLIVGHKKGSGGFHGPQPEMLVHYVFNPLWEKRARLRPLPTDSLASYYKRLSSEKWMGGWYANRVVADLKHTKQLKDSPDWQTWFTLGPGTLRGINRITGRTVNRGLYAAHAGGVVFTLNETEKQVACAEVNQLRHDLGVANIFDANDMGGSLCEFDKYERVRLAEPGKVRRYTPLLSPAARRERLNGLPARE